MKKKSVLIVDDSYTFVMYLSLILKRLGFDVIPAENGLEALKLIKVIEPNLVMLDITMPVMDGITALRLIKEDKRTAEIPIVMVTTDAKDETIEECKRLGCSGYVVKPVKIESIHEVLQKCLYAPEGIKRSHMRATYNKNVTIEYDGKSYELFAVSISEGGIYVFKKDPFPIGSKVKITLHLNEEQSLSLDATVIYTRSLYGDLFKNPPGMALEFDNLSNDDLMILKNYIKKLIAEDILESQEEIVIE